MESNKTINPALCINQGYVLRSNVDLSLIKTVQKATLSINGEDHTYKYDDDGTLRKYEDPDNPSRNTWDIAVRLSDIRDHLKYYDNNYTREIYASDYLYKVSDYDRNPNEYGKTLEDELRVFITYKLMIYNNSDTVRCRVDELVDYYDEDFTFVQDRSYILLPSGKNNGSYSGSSQYGTQTQSSIDGYQNLYIRVAGENVYLNAGEELDVFLTFEVNKKEVNGENWIIYDETGNSSGVVNMSTILQIGQSDGKENIAEINGYSTIYAKETYIPNVGTVKTDDVKAGIVDKNSNPGNLDPNDIVKDAITKGQKINYHHFENDTDKAQNVKLVIKYGDDREITGSVWEDLRESNNLEGVAIGNGLKDNKEPAINGVTVQLVELMENGTEFVWREFGSTLTGNSSIGQGRGSGLVEEEQPIINWDNLVDPYKFTEGKDGKYAFKSFVPGKYIIRFKYGDTVKTVIPSTMDDTQGKNEKSYNGQDYKSTIYQTGISTAKTYEWRKKSTWSNGQEILGDVITTISEYNKELADRNETVNTTNNPQTGWLYNITESEKETNNKSDAKDIKSRRDEVESYSRTNVKNEVAEILASAGQINQTYYKPELIQQLIDNTWMKAETGLIVVEFEKDQTNSTAITQDKEQNDIRNTYRLEQIDLGLQERPKAQLAINKEVANVKLTLADGSILFDSNAGVPATNVLWKQHKAYNMEYNNSFMHDGTLKEARKQTAEAGLIQLTMDEELMQGAQIKITYKITVSNVGEIDYGTTPFYYAGIIPTNKEESIVTTSADTVIDYVANNLRFDATENQVWEKIETDSIIDTEKLVNSSLKDKITQFNTIIKTESLKANLVPKIYKAKNTSSSKLDETGTTLVLAESLAPESATDDLTYRNILEIVEISNTVGRRNAYSVVGNQDPTQNEPSEIDADRAEVVRILPPFGNAGIYISIAITTILAAAIITGGIIFIKKKVIK